jgi:hypothetical protein
VGQVLVSYRPVMAGVAGVVDGELGSSLYRLLVGEDKAVKSRGVV